MTQVTIRDLANACGLAPSTVSRAMNDRGDVSEKTRKRVLTKAAEIGYFPNQSARSLKISTNKDIAVIVQGETNQLLMNILSLIEKHLNNYDYDVYLLHLTNHMASGKLIKQIVMERKFAGVIILGRYQKQNGRDQQTNHSKQAFSRQLHELDVPLVFCTTPNFSNIDKEVSFVSTDDFSGTRQLTEHLIALGHRQIAFCSVGDTSSGDTGDAWMQRYRGYSCAMTKAGLTNQPLKAPDQRLETLYGMEGGYQIVRENIAKDSKLTALVCTCDAVAMGAIRALAEMGKKVPDDISITGFDGLDFARYSIPSITTIAQSTKQIAKATSKALLMAISDQPYDPDDTSTSEKRKTAIWIQGTLVQGESTSRLNKTE